jgi:hypothetical protein
VYTSHFCDASGEHLTFLYGKYLTSSTEALEAVFLPLAPLHAPQTLDGSGSRRCPKQRPPHDTCTFGGYRWQERIQFWHAITDQRLWRLSPVTGGVTPL